jgi:hypothetical protein
VRARPAFFAAAALSLLVFAVRAFGPLSPRLQATPTPAAEPVAAESPRPTALVPLPARNVFEYADTPGAYSPLPGEPPPEVAAVPEPTPPPVRLVGLVRRGSQLLAALALEEEVVLLGPGDEHAGYRVVSIDGEAGVRLEGPGGPRLLAPPY